jgi:hypothetical protein
MANMLKGIGTSAPAETIYVGGYNGVEAQVVWGTPLCWSVAASDGVTLVLPATSGITKNVRIPAGIAIDTIASGEYTRTVVSYGPCSARTYGVASNFVPGATLVMVDGATYLAYGTDDEVAAQMVKYTALETNATTDTTRTRVMVIR